MRSARIELILDTLRGVRGAKELSSAVDKTTDSLDDTARAGDKAGKAIDDAGDQMSQASRAAAGLDRQIEKLSGSLREMAIAQALTGGSAFTRQMRLQEDEVRRLTKNRKLLGDFGAAGGAEAATGFAASFSQRLGPLVAKLPVGPQLAAVLAGAAVLAAPMIGATISSAVIGGAGIGGVVGGIMLVSKDARVEAASKALSEKLLGSLRDDSTVFVGPVLKSIDLISARFGEVDDEIEDIFADSSRFVMPLTDASTRAMQAILHGVSALVSKAGPVIDVIANGIVATGEAIGHMLAVLSEDGPEAAMALKIAFGLVVTTIDAITFSLHVLTKAFGWVVKLGLLGKEAQLQMAVYEAQAANADKATDALGDSFQDAAKKAEALAKKTEALAFANDFVNDELRLANDGLRLSLESLGGATSRQGQYAAALTTAMDNLYGATRRQADANQSFEASWDGLSESVKRNSRSLDVHTSAGRTNRDALKSLLTSTNELYIADINAGMSVEQATKKHEGRIVAVQKESRQLGLNRGETNKLIAAYGQIPKKKTTDLVLTAVDRVADALLDLASLQLHLAKGTPLSAALSRRLARAQYGMPDTKRAYGGPLPGHASHDRADNMVYAGTPGEWVIQRPTVRKVEQQHGAGAMRYFNKYGELPAFGDGGLLKASRTNWPTTMNYRVTAGMTKVPTLEQVIAAVPFAMGNWPSSPGAQRGDSGVWRSIVALINSTGPMSGAFGNGYRPGDPKWHGSGRAVDWMGYGQDRLASVLAARRPLELIHRTANRDYAYTRGRNMGSFNEGLMNSHRDHVHIAMANGGVLREPVFGYGMRSGNTYSLAERGAERVLSTAQTAAGGATVGPITITIVGSTKSPREIAREVSRELGRATDLYTRGAG